MATKKTQLVVSLLFIPENNRVKDTVCRLAGLPDEMLMGHILPILDSMGLAVLYGDLRMRPLIDDMIRRGDLVLERRLLRVVLALTGVDVHDNGVPQKRLKARRIRITRNDLEGMYSHGRIVLNCIVPKVLLEDTQHLEYDMEARELRSRQCTKIRSFPGGMLTTEIYSDILWLVIDPVLPHLKSLHVVGMGRELFTLSPVTIPDRMQIETLKIDADVNCARTNIAILPSTIPAKYNKLLYDRMAETLVHVDCAIGILDDSILTSFERPFPMLETFNLKLRSKRIHTNPCRCSMKRMPSLKKGVLTKRPGMPVRVDDGRIDVYEE